MDSGAATNQILEAIHRTLIAELGDVKGELVGVNERLGRLESHAVTTNERLGRLETHAVATNERLGRLESHAASTNEVLGLVHQRMQFIESAAQTWATAREFDDARMTDLERRMERIEKKLGS